MAQEEKVVYRVKQVTIVQKQCCACLGVGKLQQKMGPGQFKSVECPHCRNGVARHEHETEISLKEALLKMGIVNLVRNTMEELMKDKGDNGDTGDIGDSKEAAQAE